MILQIPNVLYINKHLRPPKDGNEDGKPIEVEDTGDGLLQFSYDGGAIELVFSIEDLRAIMRLFDVPEDDES